jgi:hypothetical protein
MAGKIARKKPDPTKMKATVTETAVALEAAQVEEAATPEESAVSEAASPGEAATCTRSHTPNARTRKALRDADDGKNLTRYVDEDDLFRKLGIKLGQE